MSATAPQEILEVLDMHAEMGGASRAAVLQAARNWLELHTLEGAPRTALEVAEAIDAYHSGRIAGFTAIYGTAATEDARTALAVTLSRTGPVRDRIARALSA